MLVDIPLILEQVGHDAVVVDALGAHEFGQHEPEEQEDFEAVVERHCLAEEEVRQGLD